MSDDRPFSSNVLSGSRRDHPPPHWISCNGGIGRGKVMDDDLCHRPFPIVWTIVSRHEVCKENGPEEYKNYWSLNMKTTEEMENKDKSMHYLPLQTANHPRDVSYTGFQAGLSTNEVKLFTAHMCLRSSASGFDGPNKLSKMLGSSKLMQIRNCGEISPEGRSRVWIKLTISDVGSLHARCELNLYLGLSNH